MNFFLIISVFILQLSVNGINGCTDMWDSQPTDPYTILCPVQTNSGSNCVFPFTYSNVTYIRCTIDGPNNPSRLPQCMISSSSWSFCQVPTNSIISYVTTRKGGWATQNGASVNGETLVWIYGLRFAKNIISLSPGPISSNKVLLESRFGSYECSLHVDKCTETQLTCWTPSNLPEDTYKVRVKVNDFLIPFYQYSQESAVVKVSYDSTPIINSFTPARGYPGSLVTLTGNFNTECYSRDTPGCGDDGSAQLSRVYFGAQLCDLLNPSTLQLYDNMTSNYLACKLQGSTVGIFNGSLIVSQDNGRSISDPKTFLVTPDELIYNFQTYAEITNVSPNIGSTNGLTTVTITGAYLYHNDAIPATIDVAGSPCSVTSFDDTDKLNTKIVCQTNAAQSTKSEYIGNRGVNLIRDNVLTSFASLGSTIPSANAQSIWLDAASYSDNNTVDVTVWFNSFLTIGRSSDYLFSVKTNGAAKLYVSTDATSANKQLVASYDSSSGNFTSKVSLVAGQIYYLSAIASKQGGLLNFDLNAKMYSTSLSGKVSAMVQTETQEIEVSSIILPETIEISYAGVTPNNGTSEVQTVEINSANSDYFVLSFDGASTIPLKYGTSALQVQKALNDLPTLETEGVTVTSSFSTSGGIVYTITFPANRGDVPDITETAGKVTSIISEATKGVPTQTKIQLSVEDAWSNLFDYANDKTSMISDAIEEIFRIRCPISLQKLDPLTTLAVFDFENECQYDEKELESTAFCGKCARKNSASLFWNVNAPMTYNQMCFSYKLTEPITTIGLTAYEDADTNTQRNAYINVNTIADNKWHFTCIDLHQGLLSSWGTNAAAYPSNRLTVLGAWIYPMVKDMYIDTLSLRKKIPASFDEATLLSLRILPKLQMVYNSLKVTRDQVNKVLTVSYRPNNCTINLKPNMIRQELSSQPAISIKTQATGPVGGTFNLNWNSLNLNGISANTYDITLRNLLQTLPGIGNLNVTRSKDCAGYKWRVEWMNGGNKLPISLGTTSLTGNSPAASVQTIIDGGVEFNPIPGDMLRTVHQKAQFSVNINGIPSKCSANCDFEWLSSATPIVSSIDTSNINLIKIFGSGFDGVIISNNIVNIGSTPCSVTSATSTSIDCKPGQGPVGTHNFKVIVLPNGLATISPGTTFTYSLTASTITPATSGTGGGVVLQVTGTGFSKQSVVNVDGNICPIQTVSYNSITCIVPPSTATSDKFVIVQVTDGSATSSVSQQFKYDFANTPVVTSISASTNLNVAGGQTITIIGTNFNTAINQVYFGTVVAKVQSYTASQIVVISPPMNPGTYDLIIPSGTIGNAKVPSQLEYRLYVSSFTPTAGSIRGGSLVTVYGAGFNTNCSLNKVSFGETSCSVLECSQNWIKCQTSNAYKSAVVDNTGIDSVYGRGYAWSTPYVTINQGDYIRWNWNAPGTLSNINFFVQQVADPTSTTLAGFSSGSPSTSGSFEYQFNNVGTFYYWSGFVDANGLISFRGVVNVVATTDRELTISVSVNGFSAQKCAAPFTCIPISPPPASSCPGNNVNLASCSVATPTSSYDFKFTTCTVATISAVSASSGSVGDSITITGTGFSTNACENIVLIGDYSCTVISNSANQIVCKIGANSGLIAGVKYSIEVQIRNSGNALQNDAFTFNFIPKITSITPTTGSTSGGSTVLIKGDGFTDSTIVQVTNGMFFSKANSIISYDQISFKTSSSSSLTTTIKVYVNGVQAVCTSPNCDFTFSSQIAPTIASVSPTSVSDAATITLSGTQFGTDPTKLTVNIGSQSCTVLTATGSQITCSIPGLNLGSQSVSVNLDGVGNALQSSLSVTGSAAVKSVTPSSGSINGGSILTIDGNGFDNSTSVIIGSKSCTISSVSTSQIVCLTPSGTAGASTVLITTNGIKYPSAQFTYDSALSPSVTSLSPSSGTDGALLTVSGSGFGITKSAVSVKIGSSGCFVQSVSNTQITCITGLNMAGNYGVQVQINPNGYSNNNIQFKYDLTISSVSATQGSYGGGLVLSLLGSGFSGLSTTITICGTPCLVSSFTNANQVSCSVPSKTYSNTDTSCPLVVSVNGATASQTFTYKSSSTPMISSVNPQKGGTGGGTLITISGTGLPTDKTKIKVTIAGSECIVATSSSTSITCNTGSYANSLIVAPVMVFINQIGYASATNPVEFKYIDLWSSIFTWGGLGLPKAGEIIVIDNGKTVYLDIVTPILKGLIIQSGSLIFDDNQEVGLNAEYIIIADNGVLQVGTEQKPFQNKATITMYGSLRSVELPIFGAKVLALRNGTLDLHGKPVGVTWTYLATTANALSTQISLVNSVSAWPIGGKIVIATTGDNLSQGQSEARTITAISADGKTLTLDSPLVFKHLSEKRSNAGVDVYIRAEVGLLSRNVVFNAVNDNSWNSLRTANACPDGFNPGEFATMTCYLGRYGDEIGSDEFGATIMINAPTPNKIGAESVIARISNVELFHVGQAFRLGRYPIHFHMIGDSPSSYVRECAIRESFNRAVNIHATNYITVERNVIYNIMGGSFFLEDGVEIGNTFQYNLAVFIKTSSSLLNEDVTPAAFWATNPNNTWIHNAVAGGTHFGWWFRLLDNPDGPSFTTNYCPKKIPLGRFYNNSVHAVGRFGLWIFPGYTPTVTGNCSDKNPSAAKFDTFVSYANDKGAEWVESDTVQFNNFLVYDSTDAGIDTKSMKNHAAINSYNAPTFYSETSGSLISDSVIIGNSDPAATTSLNSKGLRVAWERGLLIKNVKFINFPDASSSAISATEISGTCVIGCGGWTTKFKGLSFSNVLYKTLHRWNWDAVMEDLDGSLTGIVGAVVVSATNMTAGDVRCYTSNTFLNGSVCKQTTDWIRFAFKNPNPYPPVFVDFENEKGDADASPKLRKRLTHKPFGYMAALEANQAYKVNFQQADYPTNISYTGAFYGLKPNQFLIISHKMLKKPDQVSVLLKKIATESLKPLSFANNENTDWYWENSTRTLSYIIHNKLGVTPFLDISVRFDARKCHYANCVVPTQPYLSVPSAKRPLDFVYWSNLSTWDTGIITRHSALSTGLPQPLDSVKIPNGLWVVVDIALPPLTRLQVDGTVEFDDQLDNKLSVDELFINGGQVFVGWENKPFTHNMEIELTGTKSSKDFMLPNGFDSMGAKAIGVYGGLDLHGIPRQPSWTRLSVTASAGSNQLVLIESVDWLIGEEIVVSTTSYDPFQTEIFKITNVVKNIVKLNSSLQFDHVVVSEQLGSKSYSIAAGVGLLTRNVKVSGGEYSGQFDDLYGSRIIVSDYSDFVYADDNSTTIPIPVYYRGYSRISDVEFKRFGQFSRMAMDDYKYGILFSNLNAYDPARPNYVRNSAFHNGFATAIGVFNCMGMPIENNTIHRSLDYSIRVEGHSNIIRKNLVVMNIWSPTFITKEAPFDKEFFGAIDIHFAKSAVVEDNLVAGSQRHGFYFAGSPCAGQTLNSNYNHLIKGNSIYGSLSGVSIMPNSVLPLSCVEISGFTVYKSSSVGIYYQGAADIVISSNIIVDCQIGIFPQVLGPPSSLSHISQNRSIIISNNLVVGTSPNFNCVTDVPPQDLNAEHAKNSAPYGANNGGRIGVVWSNFVDGPNDAPYKPWFGSMSYNYINGLTTISGNTFAHFKASCNSAIDAVITTSLKNDDGQMPIVIKNTELIDVAEDSKVYLHRPNIGKINPSDCVDMDCDGLKKNLLTDSDGTFLGTAGASVISQSEYGWGGQDRGLGDYRIPYQALADSNGQALSPSQIYSYPGIVRDQSQCTYKNSWQAYKCNGLDYRMLVIESMDNDTESRRLSPIAILSDNRYLDLINGPQDHGWCFGYTCQKRISTFIALVAANKNYDIFTTSKPPDHIRFRIINADANFKIRLSLSYTTSNNVNVYKNVNLVDPTNADKSSGQLILKDPTGSSTYKPLISSPAGTNFVSRPEQKTFFSIDGSDYIDLMVAQDIFITFGVKALTTDSFFSSANLVSNIATLLGVPSTMIRRVEIVKDTGASSRVVKRQGTDNIVKLLVTISTDPAVLSTDSATINNNINLIKSITGDITTQYYFGILQSKAAASTNKLIITSLKLQTSDSSTDLQEISSIKLVQDASQCRAQSPCSVQPAVQLFDKNDKKINVVQLGNQLLVNVTVLQGSSNIINQYQTYFDNTGKASLETLGFSNEASDVKILYSLQVTANTALPVLYIVNSGLINIDAPLISGVQVESGISVSKNSTFSASFYLVDALSKLAIPNPSWAKQTWTACISLATLEKYQPTTATLKSTTSCVPLDSSNQFKFSSLNIDTPGFYILSAKIKSSDNKYNFEATSNYIRIQETNYKYDSDIADTRNIVFQLTGENTDTLKEKRKAILGNLLSKYGLTIQGPIYIYLLENKVYLSTSINVNTPFLLADAVDTIVNKTLSTDVIPGLTLELVSYYETSFAKAAAISSSPSQSPTSSSNTAGVIGGIIGALAAVAIITLIAIMGYRHYKSKQQSIVSSEEAETNGEPNNNNKNLLIEESETFTSEDVAAGKMKNSAKIPMSRVSTARTPRKLFNSRELTDASLGQINLENK